MEEDTTIEEHGITLQVALRPDLNVPVTLFIREEESAKTLGLRTRSGMEVLAPEGTLTEKSFASLTTAVKALLDPHTERERNVRAAEEKRLAAKKS